MSAYAMPNMVHLITDSQRRNDAAGALFNAALAAGQKRQLGGWLRGRSHQLSHLSGLPARGQGGRYAGRRMVAIAAIRGSEGRSGDFDDQFHPLSSRSRARWASVAGAMQEGMALGPVELIQVGADYYVRDGHHRISVAAALGLEMVEAVVTQWGEEA